MDMEEIRLATEIKIKKMTDSLPENLEKLQDDFFIEIEKSQLSPLNKLKKLYSFMDEVYTHINKYTTCKKGCSYCCSYYVTISDIEIQFIEKNNKGIKRKEQFDTDKKRVGTPCLFLKNDACSIYESRPYVCHRHVMFTPDNSVCSEDNAHIHKLRLLSWPKLDKSYDLIKAESGSNELHDIRDVFQKK